MVCACKRGSCCAARPGTLMQSSGRRIPQRQPVNQGAAPPARGAAGWGSTTAATDQTGDLFTPHASMTACLPAARRAAAVTPSGLARLASSRWAVDGRRTAGEGRMGVVRSSPVASGRRCALRAAGARCCATATNRSGRAPRARTRVVVYGALVREERLHARQVVLGVVPQQPVAPLTADDDHAHAQRVGQRPLQEEGAAGGGRCMRCL